jgi:hypothetical protein
LARGGKIDLLLYGAMTRTKNTSFWHRSYEILREVLEEGCPMELLHIGRDQKCHYKIWRSFCHSSLTKMERARGDSKSAAMREWTALICTSGHLSLSRLQHFV